MACDSSNSLNH
jgi:hypothetical protein